MYQVEWTVGTVIFCVLFCLARIALAYLVALGATYPY